MPRYMNLFVFSQPRVRYHAFGKLFFAKFISEAVVRRRSVPLEHIIESIVLERQLRVKDINFVKGAVLGFHLLWELFSNVNANNMGAGVFTSKFLVGKQSGVKSGYCGPIQWPNTVAQNAPSLHAFPITLTIVHIPGPHPTSSTLAPLRNRSLTGAR